MTADLVAQARAAAKEMREHRVDRRGPHEVAALLESLADELERVRYSMSSQAAIKHEMMLAALKENEALLAVARLAEKCRNTDREPDGSVFTKPSQPCRRRR